MPPAPKKTDPKSDHDLGSPYGPHPQGEDEVAGGADSSPLETEPTGNRQGTAGGDPGSKARDPSHVAD